MSEKVDINVGVALVLGEVTTKLLYKRIENENGETVYVDRNIPFRLRYWLNKNKIILDRDVKEFNQKRMFALAELGEPTEDGTSVVIKDEKNQEKYKQIISDLVDKKISRSLSLLSPDDIKLLEDDDILVSPEAMSVFINYMVDDDSLREDIEMEVNIFNKKDNKTTIIENEPIVEEHKEEVKEEVPVKKASSKKQSTKKETKKSEEQVIKKFTKKNKEDKK